MENASKALLMSGAVLIALAVISLALYAYTSYRDYATISEQMLSISQIESFNRFYQSYETREGKIRGIDVINIYNRAIDDEIGTENLVGFDSKITLNSAGYASIRNEQDYLKECSYSIDYDTNGKVYKISVGTY